MYLNNFILFKFLLRIIFIIFIYCLYLKYKALNKFYFKSFKKMILFEY